MKGLRVTRARVIVSRRLSRGSLAGDRLPCQRDRIRDVKEPEKLVRQRCVHVHKKISALFFPILVKADSIHCFLQLKILSSFQVDFVYKAVDELREAFLLVDALVNVKHEGSDGNGGGLVGVFGDKCTRKVRVG